MTRSLPLLAPCLLLALVLAGCQTQPPPPPVAVAVAVPPLPPPPPKPTNIVLDDADRAGLAGALRELATKPVDHPVGWANPVSGKRGAVKVLRDGFDAANRPCREYHSVVILDALYLHSTGFLCRAPDGSWEPAHTVEYPLYHHLS